MGVLAERCAWMIYAISFLHSIHSWQNFAAYPGGVPLPSMSGLEKCPCRTHFGLSVMSNAVNRDGVCWSPEYLRSRHGHPPRESPAFLRRGN
jgi:hypothetical protein